MATTLTAEVSAQPIILDNPPPAPPPHLRTNPKLFLIALDASLVGLSYGVDIGSIGPITEMPQFRDSVGNFSDLIQGLYVSSFLLFAALSSFGNGYLADRFGRKYTLLIGAVLAAVGAIMSASISNLPALFVARAVYAIGIGVGFSTTIVYLVEIAPAHQRGLLGCVSQLLITIGIAAAYFISYGSVTLSGSMAWRTPFIVQAVIGIAMAVGILFVPFSPRWLMSKGREAEALETLRRLRNVELDDTLAMNHVNMELAEIRADIQFDERVRQGTSYLEIFRGVSSQCLYTSNSSQFGIRRYYPSL